MYIIIYFIYYSVNDIYLLFVFVKVVWKCIFIVEIFLSENLGIYYWRRMVKIDFWGIIFFVLNVKCLVYNY